MLLFRWEDEIKQWCNQTGEPYGAVITLAQTWQLAQMWYGNRMHPAYRGRTTQEAEQIFTSLGLVTPFWKF